MSMVGLADLDVTYLRKQKNKIKKTLTRGAMRSNSSFAEGWDKFTNDPMVVCAPQLHLHDGVISSESIKHLLLQRQ